MNTTTNSALDDLVRKCAERAWRLAYVLAGNSHDADDILQQAFVIAAAKIETVRQRDNPWPWFAAVITNLARSKWRDKSRRTFEGIQDMHADPRTPDPSEILMRAEQAQALAGAVEQLPQPEREAIALVHLSGLTYREAASALDVPRSTVTDRVTSGLKTLRAKLGADEPAVVRSLSVLPIPLPSGGYEAASSSWLASAKAGLAAQTAVQTSTLSNIVSGGISGGIMVKKSVIFTSLAVALGVGLTTGIVVGKGMEEEHIPAKTADANPAPNRGEASEGHKDAAQNNPSATKTGSDEMRALQGQLIVLQGQLRDKDAKLGELSRALEDAKREAAALAAGAKTPAPAPVDSKEAQVRQKAAELLKELDAAIAAKDKAKALEALSAIAALGLGAYREFYSGYERVQAVGNPYGPNNLNLLGLSSFEFISLVPSEFVTFALKDPNGDVSPGAMTHAFYAAPWLSGISKKERAQAAQRVFENRTEAYLLDAAMQTAKSCADEPVLVGGLAKIAVNTAFDGRLRANAIITMLQFSKDQIDWVALDSLKADLDPEVQKACQAANLMRTHAVTGWLVTGVQVGMPAANAGIIVGDVIVSYGDAAVTDEASLNKAAVAAKKGTPVDVKVYRNGETITIVLTGDPALGGPYLGIDGVHVWEKE